MHIELGGQFRQGLAALDGRQRDLGPEGRGVITACTFAHVVLLGTGAYHAPNEQEIHLAGCSDWWGQLFPLNLVVQIGGLAL